MVRQPAVADRFYPGSPGSLERTVNNLIPSNVVDKQKAHAIICPHAGYVYSGELACRTIASAIIPETVIILGPNHHGRGAQVAVSTLDWEMPQGVVPIDRDIASRLVETSQIICEDETAHKNEHSLEVQIPFLQTFQVNLKIVPITIAQISYQKCEEIALAIVTVMNSLSKKPLILASTDMSHYESRKTATLKDTLALDKISQLDPEGLYQTVCDNNISMCGFIPVTITLLVAKQLGATSANLIDYTDSGAVSGDTDQVVGYAGFVIS